MQLRLRHRVVDPTVAPVVMGILNVTPDSFSDGGAYDSADQAADRAIEMVAEGADIIDVGPESTRPGSKAVPPDQQIARAIPVIEALREQNDEIAVSIDTRLTSVAKAGLDAGADIINDTSALRDDSAMVDLVATSGVPVVLMHRRGTPADMQAGGGPHYDDVVGEIRAFLEQRVRYAVDHGIDRSNIIIDPGIGFGKRVEDNLKILRHLDRLVSLGQPVLVGASRKRFIGEILRDRNPAVASDPKFREAGSLACAVMAALAGASVLRVHEVRPTVEAVGLCAAVSGRASAR
jgi:dihydropteroate synthase